MSLEAKIDSIRELLTANHYSEKWIAYMLSEIEDEAKADQIIAAIRKSPAEILAAADVPMIVPRRGGEIEREQPPMNIDARGSRFESRFYPPEQKIRFARCGDCLERYEISGDPTENHHRAMRHKEKCGKHGAVYFPEQHPQLVREFDAQPNIVAMRARLEAGLPAVPPEGGLHEQQRLLNAPAAKTRRWWQFWRWFE